MLKHNYLRHHQTVLIMNYNENISIMIYVIPQGGIKHLFLAGVSLTHNLYYMYIIRKLLLM